MLGVCSMVASRGRLKSLETFSPALPGAPLISFWTSAITWKPYSEKKLRAGAAVEEAFSLFIDSHEHLVVADFHRVLDPTICFVLDNLTAWKLAARSYSVYSAFAMGLPLRAEGDFAIRDMELMDEILKLLYDILMEEGHDLAALFTEQIAGVK